MTRDVAMSMAATSAGHRPAKGSFEWGAERESEQSPPPFTLARHETMRLDGHSSLLLDPLGPEIRKLWDSSPA